jgi:hypothetical protein
MGCSDEHLVIRSRFLELCNRDVCAAILLEGFRLWDLDRSDLLSITRYPEIELDAECYERWSAGWMVRSHAALLKALDGLFDIGALERALRLLQSKGLLQIGVRQADGSPMYRLDSEHLQLMLDSEPAASAPVQQKDSARATCARLVQFVTEPDILTAAGHIKATIRNEKHPQPRSERSCPFCHETLFGARELQVHVGECSHRPTLRTQRGRPPKLKKCSICGKEMPTVKCFVHEPICRKESMAKMKAND